MQKLNCGDIETYENTSKQREYVHIVAANHCEWPGYLWILFPGGKHP